MLGGGRRICDNVPSGLSCPICQCAPAVEPAIAPCGHSACTECWKRWLGRKGYQGACFKCRKATKVSDLSRMVYDDGGARNRQQRQQGKNDLKVENIPTLSQFVENDDQSEVI